MSDAARRNPQKMVRIQLEVTETQANRLAELKELCGFATQREFFDNAMSVFNWTVQEVRKGRVIASLDPQEKHYQVLRMPALDHAVAVDAASGAPPSLAAVPEAGSPGKREAANR